MRIIITCFIFSTLSLSAQDYYGGENGKKLDWFVYYLSDKYVDSLDYNHLTDLAIKRVVQELDPYSSYQTKAEADDQLRKDHGLAPKGSGFNFYLLNGVKPIITYIAPQGPAEKQGLRNGNQLVAINNVPLLNKSANEIYALINNETQDEIDISYLDNYQQKKLVTLVKENIPYLSVESHYMLTKEIGYIKISRFTINTMKEFVPKIEALLQLGMKDLVLDFRGNNGGVKNQAIELADEFLSAAQLINYSEGQNMPKEEFLATEKGHFEKGKIVALADNVSASATEIFLGALQDWDRCLILGTPTYGKGLIQQSFKLGDGSTIRLTIGRFYSPLGRHLQKPLQDNWFSTQSDHIPSDGVLSKMKIDAQYKLKTKGSREIVIGQGGIYPDIYFVAPKENKLSFDRYNDKGHIYGFVVYQLDLNRDAYASRFSNSTAFRNDPTINRELASAFRKYIAFNGFKEGEDPSFGTPKSVIDKAKAWIAGQLWDENAYFELTNNYDTTLDKAIELIENNTFQELKIKY